MGKTEAGSSKMLLSRLQGWQCRAARAAICWPVRVLVQKSKVSASTIKKFEAHADHQITEANAARLMEALELGGARFPVVDGLPAVMLHGGGW